MISAKNLVKVYKAKKGVEVRALDGVSIDFPDTGMVFLLGKSGSGKSTLLNMLGGLDKPDSGEIVVKGKSSLDFAPSDFDGYRNTYIGFIFQEFNILNEFTVEQNIALALQLQGKESNESVVNDILAKVDLDGFGKRKPLTLSGGQKQRVAIARALIKNPDIIMADEPTGSLDSETGKGVFETLKKLSEDKLVIIISHDREFAESYGDRIIELKDGKVISDKSKQKEYSIAKAAPYDGSKATFIKSSLPIRYAAKMGASSLRTKPIRLIATILIALLAFGLFGINSAMMMYDTNFTTLKAMEGTPYNSIMLQKNYRSVYDNEHYYYVRDGAFPTNGVESNVERVEWLEQDAITFDELNSLNNSDLGVDFAGVFGLRGNQVPGINNFANGRELSGYYIFNDINGFTDCGEDYLKKSFGNDACLAGSYPTNENEIAVSEFMFEMFSHYGLIENNIEVSINTFDDLIGRYIRISYLKYNMSVTLSLRIVGIYRTGTINNKFEALKTIPATTKQYSELISEFKDIVCSGFNNLAFVSDSFYDAHVSKPVPIDNLQYGQSYTEIHSIYKNNKWVNLEFIFAQWLEPYKDYTAFYAFEDGAELAFSQGVGIKEDETFISLARFNAFARRLALAKLPSRDGDSPDIIGDDGYVYYSDCHDEFANAFVNLYYHVFSEWIGDPLLKPSESFLSQSDVAIIAKAINADWTDWVVNGQRKSDEAELIFGDIDKIYYGGKFLNIKGVFAFKNNPNNNSWLMVNSGFMNELSNFSYNQIKEHTVYKESPDGKYTAIISPFKTTKEQINYILSLSKVASDTSFFQITENSVFFSANYAGTSFEEILWIFNLVGLGLALMASLFLFNYISVSIVDKKRDIGILRALGAKGTDVFKIFFAESIFIAATCAVLATIGAVIACAVVNKALLLSTFAFQILNFRFINALIIFAIASVVAFLGTIIPVTLAARKSPVESIRSL